MKPVPFTQPPRPNMMDDDYLTVDDVAKKLVLTRKHVYMLIKKDGLPAFRLGRDLRINSVELERWLESRRETGGEE